MIFIVTSYGSVGNESRKYIINGITKNVHFPINVLPLTMSFPPDINF